jgi:hypothetical protein
MVVCEVAFQAKATSETCMNKIVLRSRNMQGCAKVELLQLVSVKQTSTIHTVKEQPNRKYLYGKSIGLAI